MEEIGFHKFAPYFHYETRDAEKLTYTRYNNDDSKWGFGPNFSRKNGFYTIAMIGLEVYVKKRKSNNE